MIRSARFLILSMAVAACAKDVTSPRSVAPRSARFDNLAASSPLGQAIRLQILWEVPRSTADGTDYFTTPDPYERDLFGSSIASAVSYVPSLSQTSTVPLSRLVSPSNLTTWTRRWWMKAATPARG